MKKFEKNDPCPCGSGKSYVECCSQNNVVNFSAEPYNDELIEIIYQLHEFALENFNDELQKFYDHYWNEYYLDDLADTNLELIAGYSITWAIFNERIYQEKTIFDIFYRQQVKRMKYTRTKKVFKSWAHAKGSIYLVTSLNEQEGLVTIRNIATGKTYNYRPQKEQNIKVGHYLLGITIPLVNNEVEFFPASMQMQKSSLDSILLMLDGPNFNENNINDNFIEMIIEILSESEETMLDWENPLYEKIANTFLDEMNRKNYDFSLIEQGLLFWNLYSTENSPIIKNPTIYVATLEYFILDSFSTGERKTQKEVAQEYGVSPHSISYINQKFIEKAEEIYANIVEPSTDD